MKCGCLNDRQVPNAGYYHVDVWIDIDVYIQFYIYKGRFSSGLSLGIGPQKKYLAILLHEFGA